MRPARRCTCATRRAASSGGRRRCRSARTPRRTSRPTARVQPLRAHLPRDRARAASVRATGRPDQVSRLAIENRSGRRRRLSVTAYVEWALGAGAELVCAIHRDRPRRGNRGALRPQLLERRVRGPCRVRGPRGPTDVLDGDRTEFLGPKRHARSSGCTRGGAGRSPEPRARASIRAPRSSRRSISTRASATESPSFSGRRRRRRSTLADRALPRGRRRRLAEDRDRAMGRRPRSRPGEDARPLDGRSA